MSANWNLPEGVNPLDVPGASHRAQHFERVFEDYNAEIIEAATVALIEGCQRHFYKGGSGEQFVEWAMEQFGSMVKPMAIVGTVEQLARLFVLTQCAADTLLWTDALHRATLSEMGAEA